MKEETEKKLEEAIVFLASKSINVKTSIEALQYTQASVNAANALACFVNTKLMGGNV